MFWHILTWFVVGLFVGSVARLFVHARRHLGIIGTAALGVAGSFVGGFLGYVLFHHDRSEGPLQPSGLLGSIIGAMIVLWIWRKATQRSNRRYSGWH